MTTTNSSLFCVICARNYCPSTKKRKEEDEEDWSLFNHVVIDVLKVQIEDEKDESEGPSSSSLHLFCPQCHKLGEELRSLFVQIRVLEADFESKAGILKGLIIAEGEVDDKKDQDEESKRVVKLREKLSSAVQDLEKSDGLEISDHKQPPKKRKTKTTTVQSHHHQQKQKDVKVEQVKNERIDEEEKIILPADYLWVGHSSEEDDDESDADDDEKNIHILPDDDDFGKSRRRSTRKRKPVVSTTKDSNDEENDDESDYEEDLKIKKEKKKASSSSLSSPPKEKKVPKRMVKREEAEEEEDPMLLPNTNDFDNDDFGSGVSSDSNFDIDEGAKRKKSKPKRKPSTGGDPDRRWKWKLNKSTGQLFYDNVKVLMLPHQTGLQCSICSQTMTFDPSVTPFPRQKNKMKNHIVGRHLSSHICPICSKQLTTEKYLLEHIKFVHEGGAVVPCDICGKPFTSPNSMRRHRWSHQSQEEKEAAIAAGKKKATNGSEKLNMISCDQCGKSFRGHYNLKKHLEVHLDPSLRTRHMCQICGSIYSAIETLRAHIKHRHENNEQLLWFQCPQCPRKFPRRAALTKHSWIHSGTRPFVCDECGATFINPTLLKVHCLRHKGVRPHKCEFCDMAFFRPYHLRRHRTTYHESPNPPTKKQPYRSQNGTRKTPTSRRCTTTTTSVKVRRSTEEEEEDSNGNGDNVPASATTMATGGGGEFLLTMPTTTVISMPPHT